MKMILKLISLIGLGLTLLPSFFVFSGLIELDPNKNLMILGTILWFITAPFWMNKRVQKEA